MNPHLRSRTALGIAIALGCITATQARSQVIPDATLPQNSLVSGSDNAVTIDGGTATGGNLFHSFTQFDVPANGRVWFDNAATVDNIITRVTGGSASDINGTIAANSTANLFLINPNGIQFGPDAALDIGGSFVATTADAIAFADGFVFDATTPETPPILTVSVPVGLQFGAQPGAIENRSQASLGSPLPLLRGTEGGSSQNAELLPTNSIGLPPGLQVRSGNTLALVGGNLNFDRGSLTASGGRIELGSVASAGNVGLISVESGWTFDYTGVESFGEIRLADESVVDTSGIVFLSNEANIIPSPFRAVRSGNGGEIQVRGGNIAIDNSRIATTNAMEEGGSLTVTATSINLSGTVFSQVPRPEKVPAGLFSESVGTGAAGDVTIFSERLTVRDGAQISTVSFSSGRGGNLTVVASDFIELSSLLSEKLTGLFAEAMSSGRGGDLTISTRRLTVRDRAEISATTFGSGDGGNINISGVERLENSLPNTAELVEVIGGGGIFSQTTRDATGNGGNLTISTERLQLQDAGLLSTVTFGAGNAGNIVVIASDSITVSGSRIFPDRRTPFSSILSSVQPDAMGRGGNITLDTGQLNVDNLAQISASTQGSGIAGNITLNVEQLSLRNGGRVLASTRGTGNGGSVVVNASESVNLTGTALLPGATIHSGLFAFSREEGSAGNIIVNAPTLRLDDGATIDAETAAGSDGNIVLTTQTLQLRGNSSITTNATGRATGGDILIDTDTLAAFDNSDITANAEDNFAGRVEIRAEGVFLEGINGIQVNRVPSNDASDITATSTLGTDFDGVVEFQVPDVDPTQGLTAVPPAELPRPIANPCAIGSTGEINELTYTRRGGIPPGPQEMLDLIDVWTVPPASIPTGPIEARSWTIDGSGRVKLVADAPTIEGDRATLPLPNCGFRLGFPDR